MSSLINLSVSLPRPPSPFVFFHTAQSSSHALLHMSNTLFFCHSYIFVWITVNDTFISFTVAVTKVISISNIIFFLRALKHFPDSVRQHLSSRPLVVDLALVFVTFLPCFKFRSTAQTFPCITSLTKR